MSLAGIVNALRKHLSETEASVRALKRRREPTDPLPKEKTGEEKRRASEAFCAAASSCAASAETLVEQQRRAQAAAARLACERFAPRTDAHFVGNEESRAKALRWAQQALRAYLSHSTSSSAEKKPLREAALLLHGAVGSGKSTWARFAAEKAGFAVAVFSSGCQGSQEHEKLDYWIQTQPSHDLSGKPLLLVLDDVEELVELFPGLMQSRTRCPVICTGGPAVDAAFKRGCSQSLYFGALSDKEARQVVARIFGAAPSDGQLRSIQDCARGDLRQIQLLAEQRAWSLSGPVDLNPYRVFDRSRMVLRRRAGQRRLSFADLCEPHENATAVASILHHNYPSLCCKRSHAQSLEQYARFLEDATLMDVHSCLELLPLSCQGKMNKLSEQELPEAFSLEQPPQQRWKENGAPARRRFSPGDDLCSSLLRARLGAAELTTQASRGRAGTYLSAACRMTAQHALDRLELMHEHAGFSVARLDHEV